jgi:hypothetical protein
MGSIGIRSELAISVPRTMVEERMAVKSLGRERVSVGGLVMEGGKVGCEFLG